MHILIHWTWHCLAAYVTIWLAETTSNSGGGSVACGNSGHGGCTHRVWICWWLMISREILVRNNACCRPRDNKLRIHSVDGSKFRHWGVHRSSHCSWGGQYPSCRSWTWFVFTVITSFDVYTVTHVTAVVSSFRTLVYVCMCVQCTREWSAILHACSAYREQSYTYLISSYQWVTCVVCMQWLN